MEGKFKTPFLWNEFKLRNSRISLVDEPIRAVKIERKDGVYLIPLEEFVKNKKLLEGLSEEEKKFLKRLKNVLKI
ncbi:hypothetical protein JCM9492_00060 [Aquifex pyrophilus]